MNYLELVEFEELNVKDEEPLRLQARTSAQCSNENPSDHRCGSRLCRRSNRRHLQIGPFDQGMQRLNYLPCLGTEGGPAAVVGGRSSSTCGLRPLATMNISRDTDRDAGGRIGRTSKQDPVRRTRSG